MPRIVKLGGVVFENRFGSLGPIRTVTVHHTAGPKDASQADAQRLLRQYHAQHQRQGWGGLGYHVCIARDGTIILCRPWGLKGAHVGGHNTGNLGVVFHGTTGDRPTTAQVASFKYLLRYGHSKRFPASHRSSRRLIKPWTKRLGHNDWDGHRSNACPGTHKPILRFRQK